MTEGAGAGIAAARPGQYIDNERYQHCGTP